MAQGGVLLWRQRRALFHHLGRLQQHGPRRRPVDSRCIDGRGRLEVEGADALRAGLEEIGQLVELDSPPLPHEHRPTAMGRHLVL